MIVIGGKSAKLELEKTVKKDFAIFRDSLLIRSQRTTLSNSMFIFSASLGREESFAYSVLSSAKGMSSSDSDRSSNIKDVEH